MMIIVGAIAELERNLIVEEFAPECAEHGGPDS
jgi:hypothetical protein